MRLVVWLVLCVAVAAEARAPLLVVLDGPGGAMPAGMRERLAGWSFDERPAGEVTEHVAAGYRAIVWAAGENPRPFWPASVKSVLAAFMQRGGSVLVTGDWCAEPLASGTHGNLVARWGRSRHAGRVAARMIGGGGDAFAWSTTVWPEGYGADAYDPPSGPDARVTLIDPSSNAVPVAIRTWTRQWPEYRLALIGLDLGRVPVVNARPLIDRIMRWMMYPARQDFERVVRMARAGQDARGAEERARVTLECEPGAIHDLIEVMAGTPAADRAALSRVIGAFRRSR